jgi:hypothetical protein
MPGSLEVSFNSPQCGWMSIGFEGGGREFHTTTAHTPHDLALSELLTILAGLLDPTNTREEYVLQWNRDPEAFDFRFVKAGADVTLEIYQYPSDERQPKEAELEFSYTGPVRDLCNAFAMTFDQLYADRDTDEFEFNWRQPFPMAEFERFKGQIELTRLANQHA